MKTEKTTGQSATNHSQDATETKFQKGDYIALIESAKAGATYGHLELFPAMMFPGTKRIKYAGKNSVELEGSPWIYSNEMIRPSMPSIVTEIQYFVLSALNDRNGGEICLSL